MKLGEEGVLGGVFLVGGGGLWCKYCIIWCDMV